MLLSQHPLKRRGREVKKQKSKKRKKTRRQLRKKNLKVTKFKTRQYVEACYDTHSQKRNLTMKSPSSPQSQNWNQILTELNSIERLKKVIWSFLQVLDAAFIFNLWQLGAKYLIVLSERLGVMSLHLYHNPKTSLTTMYIWLLWWLNTTLR